MTGRRAVPVSDEVCHLGEAPRWDAVREELVWTDLLGGLVLRARWDGSSLRTVSRSRQGDITALCQPLASGAWLLAGRDTVSRSWDDGRAESLAVLPIPPDHRMNDGAVDRRGRLVVGTMHRDAAPGQGVLWSVASGVPPRRLVTGATIPNGLCWTPDGATLLWVDSVPGTLALLPYDQDTGALSGPRARWSLAQGEALPDGITVDAEGMVWAALWDGSRVVRVDPESGRTVATVHVPTSRPTACALGGPGLDVLFVTTAVHGLEGRGPDAHRGRVHAVHVDVPGVPAVVPDAWPAASSRADPDAEERDA